VPSPVRHAWGAGWICSALLLCTPHATSAAEQSAPDEAAVEQAVEQVRADPNLFPTRKTRVLKLKGDDEEEEPEQPAAWVEWLGDLFSWIANTSRALLWMIIATLVAILTLFIVRSIRKIERSKEVAAAPAPTHVRDLDIRPESLPDDIGAAALKLWEAQQHRAALALLYRGLLSRLVHAHAVPIRDSSTEADCVRLAAPRLPQDAAQYVARLVGVWQQAVYGGREPELDDVRALCLRFDASLLAAHAAAEPRT
jgi:hypothetical protein